MHGRAQARCLGFALLLIAALGFEFSPWGARTTNAVLELQALALGHWNSATNPGDGVPADTAAGTPIDAESVRPLSRVMTATLVIIGALVWWESRLVGWAIASSLVALTALLAVSTLMLARGVLVPTAGPGAAIVFGMLGRRTLEAVFKRCDRARHGDAARPPDRPS